MSSSVRQILGSAGRGPAGTTVCLPCGSASALVTGPSNVSPRTMRRAFLRFTAFFDGVSAAAWAFSDAASAWASAARDGGASFSGVATAVSSPASASTSSTTAAAAAAAAAAARSPNAGGGFRGASARAGSAAEATLPVGTAAAGARGAAMAQLVYARGSRSSAEGPRERARSDKPTPPANATANSSSARDDIARRPKPPTRMYF